MIWVMEGQNAARRWNAVNVGAGLLANAVDQSEPPVTDTPHSRASPLPQFYRVSSVSRWSSGWRYHPQQQC
ncbi:hypothetical protein DCC84_02395 [Pseudomonas sp. SXM-1]|nr:hypothetical protein DCC84_02395 [Pseudomonas sp. SXM-1]